MNSTVKNIDQCFSLAQSLSWLRVIVSPYQCILHFSLFMLILSALATIIITSNTRHDYRQLQSYQQQRNEAELEKGRLLLEESTLLSQARVVQMAGSQSSMEMPSQKMLLVMSE